jgi:Fe-S cluster assembly protein SufD
MTEAISTMSNCLKSFEKRLAGLPDQEASWLQALRTKARDRFRATGIPTTRHEEWRFTNLKPLEGVAFTPAGTEAAPPVEIPPFVSEDAHRLTVVNGRFSPEMSHLEGLPEGVVVKSLAAAITENPDEVSAHLGKYATDPDHAFLQLNTALFRDGAFVVVPRGKVVEKPIVLLSIATSGEEPYSAHPRNLIIAGEACQMTVVEAYVGATDSTYFLNPVTEIVLEQAAVVDHYRLQEESSEAFHLGVLQIHQARDSNFADHNLVFGGGISRVDFNAGLHGEGIECTLNGLTLARGSQLVDNHTFIHHAEPHCHSFEVYKTILDESSHGVFNGRILVAQKAQKTDAKQTNQNLLLSGKSTINTKPQLEIFADDVKCTHGATIGQLDANAIFYLRSRGIREEAARSILTRAFASYVLERIKVEALRQHVEDLLCERLPMGELVQGAL